MKHISDEQLHEYLDEESQERNVIELHLSSCDECAARLNALKTLFAELDSLPEVSFSGDLAVPVLRRLNLPAKLPTWLKLTVFLQLALAVIAGVIAIPFVVDFVSSSAPALKMPSFSESFIQLQIQWAIWLDMLSTFQMPSMPTLPIADISSIVIVSTLAAVSMLWIIGNGLLLRNQIK